MSDVEWRMALLYRKNHIQICNTQILKRRFNLITKILSYTSISSFNFKKFLMKSFSNILYVRHVRIRRAGLTAYFGRGLRRNILSISKFSYVYYLFKYLSIAVPICFFRAERKISLDCKTLNQQITGSSRSDKVIHHNHQNKCLCNGNCGACKCWSSNICNL